VALFLSGCGDPSQAERDSSGNAESKRKAVDAAVENWKMTEPKDIKSAIAKLEKALAKDPDHVEGLKALAQALQFLAHYPMKKEPADPLFHRSADTVRKLANLQPLLLKEDEEFGHLARVALYNDACAFAREKKIPEALVALREAVAFGFSDTEALAESDDFAAVRKAPEFADFLNESREKIKAAADQEVERLLTDNKPFEFDFDLKDIDGTNVSKAAFAGKVLIVDVWGTWCPPCKKEIPHFIALDKEFREQGLQIVGLNSEGEDEGDRAAGEVRKFCEREGVTYPCALITEEFLERIPDFDGFPTTMFLDRKGTVRMKVTGYHDIWLLRAAVEKLLNE
jgi:thiol-disulfide isomerase/thioredoxin